MFNKSVKVVLFTSTDGKIVKVKPRKYSEFVGMTFSEAMSFIDGITDEKLRSKYAPMTNWFETEREWTLKACKQFGIEVKE